MLTKNISFAFIDALKLTKNNGQIIHPRGFKSQEILSQCIKISNPNERVVVIPFRNNNIFLSIAETFWVLAGRNDLGFLNHYLPRALDFSDDKKTWRAGYGPRLRNWNGVDQIQQVLNVLSEKDSKRAVMNLFDPSHDYQQDSKDIPCTNWLHFIIRNNSLHLNVTLRANDLFWGFSGINSFEWSILQEMMAFWTKSTLGNLSFFIGSLHYYERHFSATNKILNNFPNKTLYDFGFSNIPFSTPFSKIDKTFLSWFEAESNIRRNPQNDLSTVLLEFEDKFIQSSLLMLQIYNCILHKENIAFIGSLINKMPISDFKIAAIEYFYRKHKSIKHLDLTPKEKEFLLLMGICKIEN